MKTNLLLVQLCIAAIFSGCGSKNTSESKQVGDALAKVHVIDYKMIITAKISVKPEKIKDFLDAAREMIEKSNKESGCSFYQLYQDPYDNSKMIFVEEYKNQVAVEAHFATKYFKAFGPKIGDLVAGPAEVKIISVAKEDLK